MKNKKLARWSIERLVRETFMYVEHLNHITERHPELVIPIARRHIAWPGLISRKTALQKDNVKLMKDIQLGDDFVLTGEWQPDALATRWVYSLYRWGGDPAKGWGLPRLTRKNKRSWFDKAWDCLLRDLPVTPENDPRLAPLGKSAKRDYKRDDPKERIPLAVRAGIKRQIWKAFDTLILPNK
jgi:hypothetical protein